ncbi:MAG TPA: bifunctional riboflavin kinase/FAD synthetase [Hyphomonadaceae bacterium]|jgi:riboflavin kinase/FMN adenylyltransferase|nr:bifunctional riboflavin kinase/FAD synthetase [Hyphomonadaceae bacterium]
MTKGAAIALGNFDGLHAGHRAVIESARVAGNKLGAPLGVATFEPPPRRYFQPDAPPFRLMTARRREIALKALGVEQVHLLKFDASMAAMTDREFCERVLRDQVGARSVSVGFDFRFGKNRVGDAASLKRHGADLGFEVAIVEEVASGGEKVSSSRIREEIERGAVDEAAKDLGAPWIVDAIVEHGEKRGRTLGFPTANMQLGEIVHPAHGVYAVWAREDSESGWRPGVANFGRTPTTGLRDALLETVVFGFDGDLYGKRLHTAFVKFLRPEQKFDGLAPLVAAMKQDEAGARALLAKSAAPPGL